MGDFDWAGLLQAGVCGLRLTPVQFWDLTPAELALMLGTDSGRPPIDRAALEALARSFPDRITGERDDGN